MKKQSLVFVLVVFLGLLLSCTSSPIWADDNLNTYPKDPTLTTGGHFQKLDGIKDFERSSRLRDRISELRQEINSIDNDLQDQTLSKETKALRRAQQLNLRDILADCVHDLAIAEGRILKYVPSNVIEGQDSDQYMSVPDEHQNTGNIIVIKPKESVRRWWTFFANGWQHAAMFSGWNPYRGWKINIIEASGPNILSRIILFEDWINATSFKKLVEKAVLIEFSFTHDELVSMINYHNAHQVGIKYPSRATLPFSKYRTKTFYCSSLVWRAHKSSGRLLDLDDEYSPLMVWPSELFTDSDSEDNVYAISW